MDCRILLHLALLAAFDYPTAGRLIMIPKTIDVMVNHSCYLNCSTDFGSKAIFWFHGSKYIYTGFAILEPYNERFEIERHEWNETYIYNLVVHSVQPEDAGEYTCAEDEGFGEKYSVQLVVLNDDPICRSNRELDEVIGQNSCNIEPDAVELECSVMFHGNIPPQMEWKKVGDDRSAPLEVSIVASQNHFNSTLRLRGDIALNNSSYVCETNRTIQKPIKCTSKSIEILYTLNDNRTVNTTIDETIQCSANTSQSCNYEWRWLQDNDFTIESSTAVLTARKSGWHRCEAECQMRNITCHLLIMRAMVYGEKVTESSQMKNIVIAVVVSVVITVVAVCVVIFVLVKCEDRPGCCTTDLSREERMLLNEFHTEPAICGLAILNQQVFISRVKRSDIEVYDSATFHFQRQMEVTGLTNPEDTVSCTINNCLYTADSSYQELLPAILRIDPINGNLIKAWNINGSGNRLSIASDTNVILSTFYVANLHEYTADGELIRIINLGRATSDRTSAEITAFHAVKLDNGQFVVCLSGVPDRVCLISTKETTSNLGRIDEIEILKEFGAGRFIWPIYLSVNSEGSILVSDELNERAFLLSADLDNPRLIISKEHLMAKAVRTCFDKSTFKWFVTDGYRIMVCTMEDDEVERRLYDLIHE